MKRWIRSWVLFGCIAGMALAPLSEAQAALNAYLELEGETQGNIKGSVTKKGHAETIKVLAISHEVVSPRDAASGLPTGKRQHKPLTITKPLDRSSPLLNALLVNNENIPEWTLEIYQPAKGGEALTYTIELTNASISSIRLVTKPDGTLVQEVAFTYQKIEWTWADGGITAMDDWESPVAKSKPKSKPKSKLKK